jgi:hypothetical protein
MSATPASEKLSTREFARRAGCDEKQVRRALEKGALTRDADGKLESAQLAAEWRRVRRDSKGAAIGADTSADSAQAVRTPPTADAPEVTSAAGASLKQAVIRKEDFAGRLKELEYLERAGKLIDLELARKVLFEEFRGARDAWLNWPAKYAALIAADLGVEADRVAEVLTGYVHKQLAALGEPGGEFRKG